jgi:hypothetical protein
MTADWDRLIPELRAWREHNNTEIDPQSWVSSEGNWELAIAYSTVFWPQFVEIDEMVFAYGTTPETVKEWFKQTGGDKAATEATINHIHILHMHHPGLWAKVSRDQILYLGRTLKAIYSTKLKHDFPERDFVFDFDETESQSLSEYQFFWYQKRHG